MNVSVHNVPANAKIQPAAEATKPTPGEAQAAFADTLKGAIEHLNNVQNQSDQKTRELATGQVDDLHDVMITSQKASITLETTVQIQQKVIDAYNRIMRMQV